MTRGIIPFAQPGVAPLVPASGNNQFGLNGPGYFSNIYPFNNWSKVGNGAVITLNMAGSGPIGPLSFTTITLTGGTVLTQVTTNAPHGLWNANWTNQQPFPTGSGGVGSWTINVSNVRQGGAAGAPQSGWAWNANSNVNVTGPNTFVYQQAAGAGTPDYADISVVVSGNTAPNWGGSLYGVADNLTQFVDANGDIQANIANVTSISWFQQVYSLDFVNGANIPTGYTRNGQTFAIQWASGTGTNSTIGGVNGTAPSAVSQTWTTGLDTAGYGVTISIPAADISNPPKQIYVGPNNSSVVIDGHTGELAAWNAGIYGSPAFENIHKGRCGTLRFMDWFGTNPNISLNYFSQWNTPSKVNYTRGPSLYQMPIEVAMQLCNRTNLDGWINVPNGFTTTNCIGVMGISKSAPGSNAIVYFGTTSGNTAVVYAPFAHPFVTGDKVILSTDAANALVGNPLVNATVTFTPGTPGTVTWPGAGGTMPSFATGQNIVFANGANSPSTINNGQSYYATNINQAANTFQIANTITNALNGTALALTGTGTNTITSGINNNLFIIGATTKYTAELLHCDTSGYGATSSTMTTSGGNVPIYWAGNSAATGGIAFRPFDLTHFTTEVTNLATKIKSLLNTNLKPHFEFGNEVWNTGFYTNGALIAQAHNFVDTNGVQVFPKIDSWACMHGYFAAAAYDAIRTLYGGSSGRSKWVGNIGVWGGNAQWTTDIYSGMDYWRTQFNPSLTRNDLFDNLATRTYWGPNFVSNGSTLLTTNTNATFTIDPAKVAASTITVPSNSNAPFAPALWAYPFMPIIFNASPPNDLATGLPLVTGGGSQNGVYSTINISGVDASGIMTVTSQTGPSLAVGMTVYAATTNGAGSFWTFNPRNITALLTGTGGTGTYQLDNTVPQTTGARNNMTAYDYVGNTGIYWSLPTDPIKGCFGRTFRFASKNNIARFAGYISNGSGGAGNTLTITDAPKAGLPQISIGQLVGGLGITECTITAGSGTSWTVNGSAQLTTNMIGLGSYTPIILDPANPGAGSACVHGAATLIRNWMNDSITLNQSNPATWPFRYSYFNFKVNEQLAFGTDSMRSSCLPFNGQPGNAFGLISYFVNDAAPCLPPNLNANMPNSPGVVSYEGGPGNNPQGLVPGTNNTLLQNDPQGREFVQSTTGTAEMGQVWTAQFGAWASLPARMAAAPFNYTGTGNLVMGQQAFFVSAVNVTARFQFTACYVSDDVLGYGSPNFQGGLNANPALNFHPVLDALAATN